MEAVKIILLGESDVGKTSLLLRFVEDTFKESLPKTSIQYHEKIIKIEDRLVKLTIWDTAGQRAYYSLIKGYYNIADGVLFVYDVQNVHTFSALSKWLEDFKKLNDKAEVLIAGNKAEDDSKKSVIEDQVKNFAHAKNLQSMEVSAKSGKNVNSLFHDLVLRILTAKVSEDICLKELGKEKEEEAYTPLSSGSPEQQNSAVTSDEINIPTITDALDTSVKSIEEDLVTAKYASGTATELHTNSDFQQEEEEDSSGEYGYVFYSINEPTDSLLLDSAEIAEEFFKRLGENV